MWWDKLNWGNGWDWTNRVALVLTFFSFWFAAPEILGEERLRKIAVTLRNNTVLFQGRLKKSDTFLIMTAAIVLVAFTFMSAIPIFKSTIFRPVPMIIGKHPLGSLLVAIVCFLQSLSSLSRSERLTKIVNQLADSKNFRRRCIVAGAFMFVVGSFIQFVFTFAPK